MDTAEDASLLLTSVVAAGHGNLRITHAFDPPRLCISGDLDYATLPILIRALESIDGRHDVSIDLAGLTFIDVGGLRALVTTADRLGDGHVLTLLAAPAQVQRLLDLTGWHTAARLRLEDPPPSPKVTLADWLKRILGLGGQRRCRYHPTPLSQNACCER